MSSSGGRAAVGDQVSVMVSTRPQWRPDISIALAASIPLLVGSCLMFLTWAPESGLAASDAYLLLSSRAKGGLAIAWWLWLVVSAATAAIAVFFRRQLKGMSRSALVRLHLLVYWLTVGGMFWPTGVMSFGLNAVGHEDSYPSGMAPLFASGVFGAPVWLVWALAAWGVRAARRRRTPPAGSHMPH